MESSLAYPRGKEEKSKNSKGRQNWKGDQTLGYLGVVNPVTTIEDVPLRGTLDSNLSLWQKLDALMSFIYPAMQFSMRTGQFKKEDWTLLDEAIRHAVKEVLFLSERAANEYLYGHTKTGCIGLPISAEESDLNRVDSAFKLPTSHDEIVAQIALQNLRNSVATRVRIQNPTDDDLSDFSLSGSLDIDEDDKPHSNPYSNIWTTARVASRRQKIQWLFSEDLPQLKFQDLVLKSSSRRKILFTIRNRLRLGLKYYRISPIKERQWSIESTPALDCHGLPWKDGPVKRCRRCTKANLETLPHVINHCEVHSRAWQLRHDGIQNRLVHAAENSSAEILPVNQKIVKEYNLRPDIVLKIDGKIFILDVVCPFENRLDSFEKAKDEKRRKYQVLVDHFKQQNTVAEIIPIVVGALGTWDSENDRFLTKIMSKSYLKKMSKICVSENIRWARDIYVEHVTGHRQFDAAAIANDSSFRPQEPPSQEDPQEMLYIMVMINSQLLKMHKLFRSCTNAIKNVLSVRS
ncbi:hypothetical protein AVEN_250960-1 [Araneus ventricosus]|uniref:Retrovirus-related Pol polyprotein from type-1 retrotransposable element R2 n=1 Tax=Araneus ventricosus TaxID=182803 RepID=A0A4Y2P123_ARAVE|nr:hypothetical protein AVEN_250960-1 [Araneus ventricosus]